MTRRGAEDDEPSPGGRSGQRRRQFEQSRGLADPGELPLGGKPDEADAPSPPSDEEETSEDDSR